MIRNALRRFMYGRYGNDQLNLFLIGFYLVAYILFAVTDFILFNILASAAIFWCLFRTLSRNYDRRRAENAKFMRMAGPVIQWFKMRRTIHRDKAHVYFKCPNCGQYLRVPRGKGKITVTCRSCGASFEERS